MKNGDRKGEDILLHHLVPLEEGAPARLHMNLEVWATQEELQLIIRGEPTSYLVYDCDKSCGESFNIT